MDFQKFLMNIAKYNWGLVFATTYYRNGRQYIHIWIAEERDTGEFEKRECEVAYMDDLFDEWFEHSFT